MGPDQLLPHVVHRHDEHGVGKGLVYDHQHNGDRPDGRVWQGVIDIACKNQMLK